MDFGDATFVIVLIGLSYSAWVINNWIRAKNGYPLEDEFGGKTERSNTAETKALRQENRQTMRAVAERIAAKIDWTPRPEDNDRDFLSAYYAALRGRLEQRLLMGKRRRDKHDV